MDEVRVAMGSALSTLQSKDEFEVPKFLSDRLLELIAGLPLLFLGPRTCTPSWFKTDRALNSSFDLAGLQILQVAGRCEGAGCWRRCFLVGCGCAVRRRGGMVFNAESSCAYAGTRAA
jgi:hypothetical protein